MAKKYESLTPKLNSFNGEIWHNDYFSGLDYKEKLVWLYLIANTTAPGVFSFNAFTAKYKINSSSISDTIEWAKENRDTDYFKYGNIKKVINKFIADGKIAPLKDSNWIFLSYFTDYGYKSISEFTMDIKKLRMLTKDYVNIRETITNHSTFFDNLTEKFLYFLKNYPRLEDLEKIEKRRSRMIKEYLVLYDYLNIELPSLIIGGINGYKA